jgi:hypothetical protein
MKLPENIQNSVLAVGNSVADLYFLGDGVVWVLDLIVEVARYELGHGFKSFGVMDLLFQVLGGDDGGLLEAADLLHLL